MYADHIGKLFRELPRNKKTRRKKDSSKNKPYVDAISAFDIECTNVKEIKQSFMYIWQWDCYINNVHHVIVGRTWDQFKYLLYQIKSRMGDLQMRVMVHNLSYEFQYFTGIFRILPQDVFCLNKRRIAKVRLLDVFDFRCSYVMSALKLSKFTEEMNTKHQKLEGERFDYSRIRTPSQALKRYQLNYCIADVISLTEATSELLRRYDDDLYSAPMTSTGYIRRETRKALNKVSYTYRRSMQPTLEVQEALEECMRGGDTHGNRYYTGVIMYHVPSLDRSSSYPACLCNCKYPKNGFTYLGQLTIEQIVRKIKRQNMALLMRVAFFNLELIDRYEASPYIPLAKRLHGGDQGCFEDNGRIISCDGWFAMTICDIDLRIILNQYRFEDFICMDAWGTVYDYLPDPFRELVAKLYRDKCSYKGIDPVIYGKAKAQLNSVYGMCTMSPIQSEIKYIQDDPDDPYHEDKVPDDEKEEALLKYSKKGFLPYQIGVWTTAWARLQLFIGSRIITDSGCELLYMDTDSLKYCKTEDDATEPDFTEYNNKQIEMSKASGMFAPDPKGKMHYGGVYEYEETYPKFRYWGAKKYCSEDEDGTVHLTLAGVPKAKGSRELERKGGIKAFKVGTEDHPKGFLFNDAGLAVVYNDHADLEYEINGEKIHITNNVFLYTDHYELSISEKYEEAIEMAHYILQQEGLHAILD